MNNDSFIKINKDGWDKLIASNKPFSNTILPEYGPFLKRNEKEIMRFCPYRADCNFCVQHIFFTHSKYWG